MLRRKLPSLRLLLLLLPAMCSTIFSPAAAQKSPSVVGVRSHGVAIISPQPRAERAERADGDRLNVSKSTRQLFEEVDLTQNSVDNSILPRTRSRTRARMSKADQAPEEDANAADVLTAEESANDPVSSLEHFLWLE